jgi:single-strand DNA-binding protein
MNETYVTLTGRVGSDVQIYDAGGQALATFRVANTPRRRSKDGEWGDGTTTWFQVKAWRRLAGHVKESLRVGDPVVVTGRLESDVWVRDDGTSSTQLVVTATSVGHDLAVGTSLYTKPARREDEPSGGDPWDPSAATPAGVDVTTGEILADDAPQEAGAEAA